MSRQPVRLPNGLLIFQDIRFRGFWVSRWYETASPQEVSAMFGELFAYASRGLLLPPIAATYSLEQVNEALTHAAQGGRAGKILFLPKG